jgi:hypothetical protein
VNDHPLPVLASEIEQVCTAQLVRTHYETEVELDAGKVLYQSHIHGLADLLGVVEPCMQRLNDAHELIERVGDDSIFLDMVVRDICFRVE